MSTIWHKETRNFCFGWRVGLGVH